MSEIREIDYNDMIQKATSIARCADDMQKSVQKAYVKIAEVGKNDWYGTAFDKFAEAINSAIPKFKEIFQVSVCQIPDEIASKAQAYAEADKGAATASFTPQQCITLQQIELTRKNGKFAFKTEAVRAIFATVKTDFSEAVQNAQNAMNVAKDINWKSTSGDSNLQELKNAFTSLHQTIDKIGTKIDEAMQQTFLSMDNIEKTADIKIGYDKAKSKAKETENDVSDFINTVETETKQAASTSWQKFKKIFE